MNKKESETIILSRVQIENILSSYIADSYLRLSDFQSLCNMALNSIPKAFDAEDQTTWPLVEGAYFVWVDAGDHEIDVWLKEKKIWAWTNARKENVTHFMPIPEVGEDDG